jgi:hypothetical protein
MVIPLYSILYIYIGINMSTTKEQRIKEQEVTISSQQQVQQKEHQQAINKALDETKDNIRRTTDEARKDIPRYTQIVNEYQEVANLKRKMYNSIT